MSLTSREKHYNSLIKKMYTASLAATKHSVVVTLGFTKTD